MKRTRRHHSPASKREAVALVQEQGYRCAAAGRSVGISGALIGRWKNELESHATGGHPGLSGGQEETTDRYVIAAYSVPITQAYAVNTSSLLTKDTDSRDGNVVRVYVNDTLKKTITVTNGTLASFGVELGALPAGDHIYLAVSSGAHHFYDSFQWDFTIAAAN